MDLVLTLFARPGVALEQLRSVVQQLAPPVLNLVGMNLKLLRQ
jgi:hypothetical protein